MSAKPDNPKLAALKDSIFQLEDSLIMLEHKLKRLLRGEDVITNAAEMELLEQLTQGEPFIRSLPNPSRCGILDQYVAWIGDPR